MDTWTSGFDTVLLGIHVRPEIMRLRDDTLAWVTSTITVRLSYKHRFATHMNYSVFCILFQLKSMRKLNMK